MKKEIKAIVAVDKNFAIGKDNKMMWHIKDDFKHFKEVTSGSMVFMGRKTYLSIGMSLPNRQNVILTSDKTLKKFNEKDIIVNTLEELVQVIESSETDVFCIGGGMMYKHFINDFSEIYLTEVNKTIEDADTFFPSERLSDMYFGVVRPTVYEDGKLVCKYLKYIN